jgi:hypothetical protein
MSPIKNLIKILEQSLDYNKRNNIDRIQVSNELVKVWVDLLKNIDCELNIKEDNNGD